jgi:hypothetical protein
VVDTLAAASVGVAAVDRMLTLFVVGAKAVAEKATHANNTRRVVKSLDAEIIVVDRIKE